MANPQCEKGFTRIANEILEALGRIRIPGEARQVFDVILRKTYGFQKREDAISLSQFCLHTGIKKPNVIRAIKQLQAMNLIIKSDNDTVVTYRINKNFEIWRPLSKKIKALSKSITKNENSQHNQGDADSKSVINSDNNDKIVINFDNESLSKAIPTKENIQKKIFLSDSIEVRLSELLLSLIRQRNENFKQPDIQKWAAHINRMTRIDQRPVNEIEKLIQWCQADAFWQNNILSTEKLRKQYDTLYMKAFCGNDKHIQERQRYY